MGSRKVQGRLPRCAHGSDRGKGGIRWEGDRRKAEGEETFDEGHRSGGCASGESESAERRKEEARAPKNEASQKGCVMQQLRGAHAPRVLAMAPPPSRTFPTKNISARAPKPAREARALPEPKARLTRRQSRAARCAAPFRLTTRRLLR